MRRTHPTALVGLGLAGIVAGYLLELGLRSAGVPVLVPPVSLPVTLVIIAVIIVVLAVPILRAVHGRSRTAIDPFRAMRVAVLAKASSLSGALLTGGTGGILIYMLTLKVLPSGASLTLSIAALAGAIVLLICGLVAEYMCTLPPDDEDGEEKDAPAA